MKPPAGLRDRFRARFGAEPRIFRAPGRTNLIGEHTDYNDGFVMPAAIGFSCWVAAAPRTGRTLALFSENFGEAAEADFSRGQPLRSGRWSDYPVGVAVMLARAGALSGGASLLIHGEVPLGAGLSSSAALEVATATALIALNGAYIPPVEVARLCQRAEHKFAGVRCGIMDQFIAVHGKAGHALLLDCRSLRFELLPLPASAQLVVCNTMVRHDLGAGEYNRRRADCEEAVRLLSTRLPGIRALRDVTPEQLAAHQGALPERVARRARHVVTENARVLAATEALRQNDLARCGRLMAESHASLRQDYQVSCAELDAMVEIAGRQSGVIGARMTGGGFGGCTINLVESPHVETFCESMEADYEKATGRAPQIYICATADAAGEATPN